MTATLSHWLGGLLIGCVERVKVKAKVKAVENSFFVRHTRLRLMVVLAVTGLISLTACNRDPVVRRQRYFDSGMKYLESQKLDEAAIEFRNALKVDPRFAEAGTMLAKVLLLRREYSEVHKVLLNAIAAKPDYLPARLTLGGLYLAGNRVSEARQEVDYVLERSPNNVEALVLLATSQAVEKDLKEAEETLNRVLKINPKYKDALVTLAAVKMTNRLLPEAEALLRQVIANAPDSQDGYLRLASFFGITGRAPEAEPLLVKAVELSKNSAATLAVQANYYIALQKWPEAETVARKIQSLHGSEERYWTSLADFFILRSEWDKARVELERVLQEHKKAVVIRRKLVEVHLALKNGTKAEEINEAILKENGKDALAHLAKGRMLLARGDLNNALLELNQTKQFQPSLPALYFWYGQLYTQKGDLEQAKQSLGEALKFDPNYWLARLTLAELQNRTGSPDAALMNVQEVLKRNPRDLQANLIMSQAFLVKKDFVQAEKLLKTIVEQAPGNTQGHWQLGLLELQKGNFVAARQQLEQVWTAQPQAEPALMATVMSFLMEKQSKQALGFLEQQLTSRPELASFLFHMRGEVNRLQNKPEEAIRDYTKSLAGNPDSVGSAIALASLYADGGKPEQAIQLLQDTQKRRPQDPSLALATAWILERSQRWQEAQKAYERVLALDSRNPLALNNLAWLLAEHGGNIDVALKYAQQAKELQGNNVNVTNTIGWLYYKKNSYQLALEYLKEAATKVPANPLYQYQLGLAYVKLGKTAEARQALEKALQLDPKFSQAGDARKALAELSRG